MKQKSILTASCLALMALACVFTLSLTSCSKDDGGDSNTNTLIGLWYSTTSSRTYYFNKEGKGMYESGGDVWADFTYTTSGGYDSPAGSIYCKFTYTDRVSHNIWRNEMSGTYRVFGSDSLRLTLGTSKDLFVRNKPK